MRGRAILVIFVLYIELLGLIYLITTLVEEGQEQGFASEGNSLSTCPSRINIYLALAGLLWQHYFLESIDHLSFRRELYLREPLKPSKIGAVVVSMLPAVAHASVVPEYFLLKVESISFERLLCRVPNGVSCFRLQIALG